MRTKIFIGFIIAYVSTILISCGGENQIESSKKIEVTGSAEMEFVPNEIYMTFTLKEYLDAAKKKVKLENIKTDFLSLCKETGVADSNISISGYTGNERWDYSWYKRRKKEPDFMSSISYTIKVNSPDKLDKIIAGFDENAITNFYVSKTSHSDIEKLRKEVKTEALIAGKNKADYLAKSIGAELGEALLIQEIENSYYPAQLSNSNIVSQTSMNIGNSNSSEPDFQKIKLRYEMKIVFRLK
jgi:uncharacterized protein